MCRYRWHTGVTEVIVRTQYSTQGWNSLPTAPVQQGNDDTELKGLSPMPFRIGGGLYRSFALGPCMQLFCHCLWPITQRYSICTKLREGGSLMLYRRTMQPANLYTGIHVDLIICHYC